MSGAMQSCIYEGRLRHHRRQPKPHSFSYPLYMLWLDLAEVDQCFNGVIGWSSKRAALGQFKRSDYLRPIDQDLTTVVRQTVQAHCQFTPEGRICLLSQVRVLGAQFNPVVFYYCYDLHDNLQAIVAEITNTPWNERHCYVLDARKQTTPMHFEFTKAFHVSPFMPMALNYRWSFNLPGDHLLVHMQNFQSNSELFSATLNLKRHEMNARRLQGLLIRYPIMTVQVFLGIYWQALRLKLKSIPFYSHP